MFFLGMKELECIQNHVIENSPILRVLAQESTVEDCQSTNNLRLIRSVNSLIVMQVKALHKLAWA